MLNRIEVRYHTVANPNRVLAPIIVSTDEKSAKLYVIETRKEPITIISTTVLGPDNPNPHRHCPKCQHYLGQF